MPLRRRRALAAAPALLVAAVLCGSIAARPAADPAPGWREALARISADSLRGHVSFLASDLLEGRDTPSRGLEVAAEYIAAQFRRAALQPGGNDGYFQSGEWLVVDQLAPGVDVSLVMGGRTFPLKPETAVLRSATGLDLSRAAVRKVTLSEGATLLRGEAQGKVLAALVPQRGQGAGQQAFREFVQSTPRLRPSLVIYFDPGRTMAGRGRSRMLVDPDGETVAAVPALIVSDEEAVRAFEKLPAGEERALVSLQAAAPQSRRVQLRNVVGVLPGSDPALKDTCVVLSAHYDHLGTREKGEGDITYNGANDDASGVAGVMDIAAAFAGLPRNPRRSVVFAAFFGEEKGMLGSGYYLRHAPCRLARTDAVVNLEQIGRTDAPEGPEVGALSLTGLDYSDVGKVFMEAGAATGVRVHRHESNSDSYFRASDNYVFAERGIPAHSVTVAYQYPDYHRPGDHWDKLDYGNMARVVRTIALAVLEIADSPQERKWDESNSKTAPFRKARSELGAQ